MRESAAAAFIAVVEDDLVDDLRPLTDVRAAHRIVAGAFRVWDRLLATWQCLPRAIVARPAIAARERDITSTPVYDTLAALAEAAQAGGATEIVLVLSRMVADPLPPEFLGARGEAALFAGGQPLALRIATARLGDLAAHATDDIWTAPVSWARWCAVAETLRHIDGGGELLRYPWDVLSATYRLLAGDIAGLDARGSHAGDIHRTAVLERGHDITILAGARIDAFAVLDAREGPILIGSGAVIKSHARITGPAVIGHHSHVVHGVVHGGTMIGAGCRIGGEVGESVFLGFSNKAHEGYVGNSVICPWVNLGALTTTSNLKNTYGPVKVTLDGKRVTSGHSKLGSIIGDHVKTAIGTLLGTGTILGVGTNVFGGGLLQQAFVPAFVWGAGPGSGEYALDRMLSTARTAMGRRDIEMSEAEEALLTALFQRTAARRAAFLGRSGAA